MPQPEQTHLEYALRYAELGFAVLPLHSMVGGVCSCGQGQDCPSPGKHPLTPKGVKEASCDRLVIEGWFTRWPDANIGIATGPASGFFAVDVDPRNGGTEMLDHLTSQHTQLPDTATAETGGGGFHYLFKWDDRRPPGKLGKGVDVKGDGGYIVVEPSNHKSGKAYGWRDDANPLKGGEIATAPDWIFEASPSPAVAQLGGVGHLAPERILELRSALAYLDADDRDTWIRVGIALKSTSAPQAYGVWTEWSQYSEKFDPAGQRKTWATLNPESLNVESIFTWAQAAGWVNPASKVAQAFDGVALAAALEQRTQANDWHLTPVGDLLSQPAPTRWIVKHFLDGPSLACLYGPWKSGKTFCAAELACAVATGSKFFDLTTKQCPVVYMAGEGHIGLRKRFLAWQIVRAIPLAGVPLYVSNAALSITVPDQAQKAIDSIEALPRKPGLIIVDTLARHIGAGKDENATTDMGLLVSECNVLMRHFDCTVLLVHHTGHQGDRMRGSSALPAAVEWSYLFTRKDGTCRLTNDLAKDHELLPPKELVFRKLNLPWLDEDGEPETSGVLDIKNPLTETVESKEAMGKNQELALRILLDLTKARGAPYYVARKEWQTECKKAGMDRNRFAEARSTLLTRMLINHLPETDQFQIANYRPDQDETGADDDDE